MARRSSDSVSKTATHPESNSLFTRDASAARSSSGVRASRSKAKVRVHVESPVPDRPREHADLFDDDPVDLCDLREQ